MIIAARQQGGGTHTYSRQTHLLFGSTRHIALAKLWIVCYTIRVALRYCDYAHRAPQARGERASRPFVRSHAALGMLHFMYRLLWFVLPLTRYASSTHSAHIQHFTYIPKTIRT
jgi:hypothetical protein